MKPIEGVLYRLPDVIQISKLSKGSIYSLMNAGDFPRPVKLARQAKAWRGKDLIAWVESREEAEI